MILRDNRRSVQGKNHFRLIIVKIFVFRDFFQEMIIQVLSFAVWCTVYHG